MKSIIYFVWDKYFLKDEIIFGLGSLEFSERELTNKISSLTTSMYVYGFLWILSIIMSVWLGDIYRIEGVMLGLLLVVWTSLRVLLADRKIYMYKKNILNRDKEKE